MEPSEKMRLRNSHLESQLDELLGEDFSALQEREKTVFDRETAPWQDSLVLFGAGNLGRKTLSGLRQAGLEPRAFSDNNPVLWNKTVDGLMVLSPQDAAGKFGDQATFVVTIWGAGSNHRFAHTRRQLYGLGCSHIVPFALLFWKFSKIFLPYYCLDLPHNYLRHRREIHRAFGLWAEEASINEYLAQLRWRWFLDFDCLPDASVDEQYFPRDTFQLIPGEVFVDCGAFDGDTIRTFIKRQGPSFKQIVALEPDPTNYQELCAYLSGLDGLIREKVTVMPLAAGSSRGKVRFEGTGQLSAAISEAGSIEVTVAPLDEILGKVAATYIKMDIEGAELDALMGARKIIQRDSPLLAISAYHRFDHLWRVPLLIQSLSGHYRYYLKAHSQEGWDLVCYAIPEDRL
jgi:FkbM family methyltransferase